MARNSGKEIIPAIPYSDIDSMSPEELDALALDSGFISVPGFVNVDAGDLRGVPFYITGVRYQKPVPDKARGFRDYVTLECTMGSETSILEQLNRGRITRGMNASMTVLTEMSQLPASPGERIVVNDGSTGIRRTMTELLHRIGLIVVRSDDFDPADKSVFDAASNTWDSFDTSQTWTAASGEVLPYITHVPSGKPFLMRQRQGTRASFFVNEFTGPEGAVTNYL